MRANEPGCQHYFNWYVEEEPCDGGDEASETQGDQGVAEVIDEQALAEEEEDDGRWPRWLRITVWFFAIVIVLQIVSYLVICIPNPDDPYCETTTTTTMMSTFFTDLIDEFLPQKLVFDF